MIRVVTLALLTVVGVSAAYAQDRTLPAGAYRGLDAAERATPAPAPAVSLQQGRSEAVVVKTHRKHRAAH